MARSELSIQTVQTNHIEHQIRFISVQSRVMKIPDKFQTVHPSIVLSEGINQRHTFTGNIFILALKAQNLSQIGTFLAYDFGERMDPGTFGTILAYSFGERCILAQNVPVKVCQSYNREINRITF